MGEFARKADGRRIFTVEFKRGIVQQLVKGEKTLAEVSRELDIQPSVIREWKRRVEAGATTAVAANEDVVPASALREAQQRIRELERLLGRKQMEVEILQAAQELVKKVHGSQRVREVTGHPVAAICRTLGLARQTAYYTPTARARGHYRRVVDGTVLQQIHAVTNSRATYGYRHVWTMVNRPFRAGYNRKRIRRVMRMHGLMLAPRVHRRHDRPHLGQVEVPTSNQRWCSDMFLIPCWSGEVVSVLFAIDCHDREVPAWVASPRPLTGADVRTLMNRTLWARFSEATVSAPVPFGGCPTTARSTPRRPPCSTRMRSASPRSPPRPIARRATGSPRPSSTPSSATTSSGPSCAMPRPCWSSSRAGSTTITARRRIRRSACGRPSSTGRA
jgi:transposase-like protein/transposase InsO family protein